MIHKNNSSRVAPNEEPGSSKPRYQLRENPKKTYKDCNLLSSSSQWSDESETEDGSDPDRRNRLQNPNGKSCFMVVVILASLFLWRLSLNKKRLADCHCNVLDHAV